MKVLVAPVIWRSMDTHMALSLYNLMTHEGYDLKPFGNDALIERSRSRAATYFLERTDCDVMLSIDSDIEFRDQDAVEICEQAMEYKIVAGLYVTRSPYNAQPACRLSKGVEYDMNLSNHTPMPIDLPATGFLAMHRDVVRGIVDYYGMRLLHPNDEDFRMYPIYTPFESETEDGEPIFLSEDWAFGERAKQSGFQSYMNPSVRLGHWGEKRYMLEDMLNEDYKAMPLKLMRQDGGYAVGYPEKVKQ